MSDSEKYDVAISLRWTDEEHARELHELLRDRLDVFFADEKQEEFVGTDGEETFGHIFRDKARIVVVFYRPDWGDTPFTRAEESAIKQRAWNEGYGFSIWVPMGEEKSVPPYLPPQHMWFDFEKYGAKGLASVVEERVRESGQSVRPETTEDRLRRKKRRIEMKKKRRKFEGSDEGVQFVANEFNRFRGVVESQVDAYESIDSDIPFNVEGERRKCTVTSWPYKCIFYTDPYASNSIREASLTAYLKVNEGEGGRRGEWKDTGETKFEPTLDESGEPTWRLSGDDFYSLEMAVSYVLDDMAERVYDAVEKRFDQN